MAERKGVAGKGDIKDQTLAYSPDTIKSFVVVFKGSSMVKEVHGITKYHGRHAPELNGTFIGIGKWRSFSKPQLVHWTRVMVPASTTAFREFHANPQPTEKGQAVSRGGPGRNGGRQTTTVYNGAQE